MLLKLPQVMEMTTLSRSTIYSWIRSEPRDYPGRRLGAKFGVSQFLVAPVRALGGHLKERGRYRWVQAPATNTLTKIHKMRVRWAVPASSGSEHRAHDASNSQQLKELRNTIGAHRELGALTQVTATVNLDSPQAEGLAWSGQTEWKEHLPEIWQWSIVRIVAGFNEAVAMYPSDNSE